MNQKLLSMLNDAEQELVREVEPERLDALDEDGLLDLHTRIRRARTKYTKLYRRRAAAQVGADASRGRASAVNNAPRTKAEIFEDALAVVSRRLAAVAKQSAADLRAERLAAARGETVPGRSTAASGPAKRVATKRGGDGALRSPVREKANASTRAAGKRRQAERDSR
jgi:hypothetical protein